MSGMKEGVERKEHLLITKLRVIIQWRRKEHACTDREVGYQLGSGVWFGVLRIEDGVGQSAVALVLDGLPVVVEELLEHGGG